MATDIQQIKDKAIPVLKEAGVTKSSLFGSVARGEMNENSDIDILIELPRGKTLFDLVALENRLQITLGRKVDLLTYKSIHPLIKNYVYQNEIQIL